MIINNSIIVAENGKGVSSWEPYKVLGVKPRSTGYEVNYICSNLHGKIKMWAKYKPVALYGVRHHLTEAQFKSVNYGLVPPDLGDESLSALTQNDFAIFKTKVWTYRPPDYSKGEPYRISDFAAPSDAPVGTNGYNDNAQCPVVVGIPETYHSNGSIDVTFHMNNGGNDSVSLLDLNALSEFRPALLLHALGPTNVWYYISANKTFAQLANDSDAQITGSVTINIPRSFLSTTNSGYNWEIVAFAAKPLQTNPDGGYRPNDPGEFTLLPMADFSDIYGVVKYSFLVNISAMWIFGANNNPFDNGNEYTLPSWHLDNNPNAALGAGYYPIRVPSADDNSLQVGFCFACQKQNNFPYSALHVYVSPDDRSIYLPNLSDFSVAHYDGSYSIYKVAEPFNEGVHEPGETEGDNELSLSSPAIANGTTFIDSAGLGTTYHYFMLNIPHCFNYNAMVAGQKYKVDLKCDLRGPNGVIVASHTFWIYVEKGNRINF